MKYWVYDFFNDWLSKEKIENINELIQGENNIMVNYDPVGIQNMIITFFEGKNKENKS